MLPLFPTERGLGWGGWGHAKAPGLPLKKPLSKMVCLLGSGGRSWPPSPMQASNLPPLLRTPPHPRREGVQEASREEEGYFIRSGIVVVARNATIKAGTRI